MDVAIADLQKDLPVLDPAERGLQLAPLRIRPCSVNILLRRGLVVSKRQVNRGRRRVFMVVGVLNDLRDHKLRGIRRPGDLFKKFCSKG